LRRAGVLHTADRPAERGDFLTLDISATRDGDDVPGLNTEDWSYELGQGWVAEDFDDHLTGVEAGAVVEFTTTPKGTSEPAEFRVSVTAVQELVVPEATDDWVSENTGEYETVEEWRAAIVERLAERKLGGVRQQVMGKLTDALVALVDVDAPEAMVQAEMRQQVQNLFRQLQMQGIDASAWFSATGQSVEQMMENGRPRAEAAVKADLALRAVAVAEDLEATDDDVEFEYARMALQFGQNERQIRRAYEQNDAVPELIAQIRKSKAMDWLLHHVEMVDPEGATIDRALVLGHDEHEHEHEHEHDGEPEPNSDPSETDGADTKES
jgi:trigger factor